MEVGPEVQEPCHANVARFDKARLLHHARTRAKTPLPAAGLCATIAARLTAAEILFGMRNHVAALVAYRAASDIAGKAAVFAVTVLAARSLSREGFGVLSLGMTAGWLAAAAADIGMQMHVARAVAHRPHHAAHLLDVWLRVRQRWGAMLFAAIAASLWAFGAPHAAALLVFVACYLASGIAEFAFNVYRGLSRSDLESTTTLWWRGSMLVTVVLVLATWPSVAAIGVAMLVPTLLTAYVAIRRARSIAITTPPAAAVTIDVAGDLRRDVLPIGLGVLLSAAYFRIDVLLLEAWRGTEAVGLYHAVFRLVDALRLFPAAVLAVLLPALCRATSAHLLMRVAAGLVAFALVVAAILSAMGDTIVRTVYGPGFAEAVPAFRVLLLAFPLMCLNYALTQQLIGWNGHRAYAVACAAALAVNLALNAQLIPSLSIVGAAWATVWTEAAVTAGCAAALWSRRYQLRVQAAAVGAAS
jgi:O-antigen/teichoic acid export membrane protein